MADTTEKEDETNYTDYKDGFKFGINIFMLETVPTIMKRSQQSESYINGLLASLDYTKEYLEKHLRNVK